MSVLKSALAAYVFPYVVYDFFADREISCSTMFEVEDYIQSLLRSVESADVKCGLANVLYWGYAQIPYRDVRVGKFLDNISYEQLGRFIDLVQSGSLTCSAIKRLGMAQFSGLSFISKVMMFHDPNACCVLDNQILKMRDGISSGSINNLKKSLKETSIRISKSNERHYLAWCEECRTIACAEGLGRRRPVDAERAFFALIQSGRHELAKSLYLQHNTAAKT